MNRNRHSILSVLMIITIFCSCGKPKRKINPQAKKLNDSAVLLVLNSIQEKEGTLTNAINLLNKATKIDTDYYLAYQNKFAYQTELKQYGGALESAKHMLKLYPNDVTILALTGEAYERAGDKMSATLCYNNALSNYYKILDTMSVKNKNFCSLATGKAMVLTLLNKKQQGDAYLKEILQKNIDPVNKEFYEIFLAYSRNDVLYGKSDTVSENANPVKY